MSGFLNYKSCAKCGGQCCQTSAGIYSPADFKEPVTVNFILSLLRSGKYSIDKWDADENLQETFFVRPRHVEAGAIDFAEKKATCIRWNAATGCELSEKERPLQCLLLVPNFIEGAKVQFCFDSVSKLDMAKLWLQYQKQLAEVVMYYK